MFGHGWAREDVPTRMDTDHDMCIVVLIDEMPYRVEELAMERGWYPSVQACRLR